MLNGISMIISGSHIAVNKAWLDTVKEFNRPKLYQVKKRFEEKFNCIFFIEKSLIEFNSSEECFLFLMAWS